MKFTNVIFGLMLTWSASGFASTTDFGNGGNIILCPAAAPAPVAAFYDVYEATARYDLTPQFPIVEACELDAAENYHLTCKTRAQKVAMLLASRLKNLDPKFEALLQTFIEQFWNETRLVDAELFPVADSGLGFIPAGCTLKQLAIQHVPRNKDDKRYFIAANLLKYLRVEEQGALILHEVLFRWATVTNSKMTFSEGVRYFNALIFSDRISNMSSSDYVIEKNALVAN